MRSNLLFALVLILWACLVHAQDANANKRKLTPAEIDERAVQADKEIWHMGPGMVEERIQEGTWLVFYGVRWCNFCKRLSPRWLYVQRKYLELDLIQKDFYISKVDCTDVDEWCAKMNVDAYPTIYLYHNGKFVEEYTQELEPPAILNYISQKIEYYEFLAYKESKTTKLETSQQQTPTPEAKVEHEEL